MFNEKQALADKVSRRICRAEILWFSRSTFQFPGLRWHSRCWRKERRDISFHVTLQFVSSSVILPLAWEEVKTANFKNGSHWTHSLHIRRQDIDFYIGDQHEPREFLKFWNKEMYLNKILEWEISRAGSLDVHLVHSLSGLDKPENRRWERAAGGLGSSAGVCAICRSLSNSIHQHTGNFRLRKFLLAPKERGA